jgi:uncharacterized damage-inducible protein DinB
MPATELQTFLDLWDAEAKKTLGLLRALPAGQYDFRPDPGGRSLGELAWHLAEADAHVTFGIEQGRFERGTKPPGIERPRSVDALAPGYEHVHADAATRVRRLGLEDLGRTLTYFDGKTRSVRDLLWSAMLFHNIHHRGQLSVLCRLAGGTAPGMYGPNREEMARLKARAGA